MNRRQIARIPATRKNGTESAGTDELSKRLRSARRLRNRDIWDRCDDSPGLLNMSSAPARPYKS